MRVDDLADVRAGDKGDTLILAVLPRGNAAYDELLKRLTPELVAAHFGDKVSGNVHRHELPKLPGFVLRIPGILAGGVTGSVTLDGHGKTLSYHLAMLDLGP